MEKKMYLRKVILMLQKTEDVSYFHSLSEKLRACEVDVASDIQELDTHTSGVLYITDDNQFSAEQMQKNIPVLGWSHEGGASLNELPYIMEAPEALEPEYLERTYRRFAGIPWDILETERCLIRETIEEDVEFFFQIYSNPEIVRYTEELYPDMEQEKKYVRQYIEKVYRYFEFGVWTVLLKDTGEVIGRAGFSVREGYDLPELGFIIGVPWQGKGIAYEICQAILQYGRDEFGFERVQALVRPGNDVSFTLCHKLGFVEKAQVMVEGKAHSYLFLSKNK